MAYLQQFQVRGKTVQFPVFFPDATRGVIRSLDSVDIKNTGTPGLIVNTYHLMSEPGTTVVETAGGIKNFMGWDGWIISDSGGFQVLSLIYKDPSFGKITDDGVTFLKGSKGKKEKHVFTPERSIQVQFALSPDIMVCLDDCPAQKASREKVEQSVNRTIAWAKRCKEEFERQLSKRHFDRAARRAEKSHTVRNARIMRSLDSLRSLKMTRQNKTIDSSDRPLLFAIIQGNDYKDLRERCAKALIEIGFDGYGFGGWPVNEHNHFNADILSFTASCMPDHLPKYALGVGYPKGIIECVKMGYTLFDTVLPTRDARHERLYVFTRDPKSADIFQEQNLFGYVQIKQEQYVRDNRPVSEWCDCFTCQHYSRSYLHHLFEIEDSLAHRLATIHNLRLYAMVMEQLRERVCQI